MQLVSNVTFKYKCIKIIYERLFCYLKKHANILEMRTFNKIKNRENALKPNPF